MKLVEGQATQSTAIRGRVGREWYENKTEKLPAQVLGMRGKQGATGVLRSLRAKGSQVDKGNRFKDQWQVVNCDLVTS